LNPSGFRQKSSDGVLAWTNWYAALSDRWLPPGSPRDSLAELQSLLEEQPPPQPQQVFQAADSVCGQLDALLAGRPGFATPSGRARLMKALASEKLAKSGWMKASQWMLAVTACVDSFDRAQVEAHAPGLWSRLENRLEALEDRLAFAPGRVDETPHAASDQPNKIINSPRAFDPTDPGYRQLLTEIREDLKKLAGVAIPQDPEAER
jgi:hypothetical protein